MIALMFLLGGVGRAIVGTGRGPSWIGRWSVYLPIALLSASVGVIGLHLPLQPLHLLICLWVTVVASLNLGLGYTQWESWKWMSLRFGLPSAVAVAPLIYVGQTSTAGLYILLSLFAANFYPHRQRVFEWLHLGDVIPRWVSKVFPSLDLSWLDSSRLAEFVAGAFILGGLSILN